MKLLLMKQRHIKKKYQDTIHKIKESNNKVEKRRFREQKGSANTIIMSSKKVYIKTKIKKFMTLFTKVNLVAWLGTAYKNGDFNYLLQVLMKQVQDKKFDADILLSSINETWLLMMIDSQAMGFAALALAGAGGNILYTKYRKNKMKNDAKKVVIEMSEENISEQEAFEMEKIANKKGASAVLAPYVYLAQGQTKKGQKFKVEEDFSYALEEELVK